VVEWEVAVAAVAGVATGVVIVDMENPYTTLP